MYNSTRMPCVTEEEREREATSRGHKGLNWIDIEISGSEREKGGMAKSVGEVSDL